MSWLAEHWLDILGWGGSVLLVFSLLQPRVFRLRTLNLAACAILAVFNGLLGIWPMVAMNVALCAINLWFLVRMVAQRHDQAAFTVLHVRADDVYLWHVLGVHGEDIARFNPRLDLNAWQHADGDAWLIQHGDETVGVVLVATEGETARIVLDYVTPRYRDFSPGEFVWREHGLLRGRGVRRVVSPPDMVDAYYGRIGFRHEGDSWVLDLT
jgi:hypothetical protein